MKPGAVRSALPLRLAWAALLLPAALAVWSLRQVALAYSPVPVGDYWMTIAQYRAVVEHGLTFSDLFAQHNEHRIFFPRLVFFADLTWFHGRGLLNFAAIAAIQLLGAAVYATIARPRTLRPLGVLGLALAIALMFTLRQWENFYWAFQVQFVGVFVAGAWAIYLFCRGATADAPRWGLVLLGLVLLGVAAFSMANGALAGSAMALAVVIARRSKAAAVIALIATAALFAIYVFAYNPAGNQTSIATPFHHPAGAVVYLLSYLGNLWSFDKWQLAAAMGAAGCLGTLGMAIVVFRERGRDLGRCALLGVAIFIGLSAALTSLGRFGLGIDQALSSRYTTPTAHFWAAQALFWALTFQEVAARQWKVAGAAALVLAGAWLIPIQRLADRQLIASREHILLAGSALLGGRDDAEALRGVCADPAVPLSYEPFLRARRLSVFAGSAAPRAGAKFTPARVDDPKTCFGFLDVVAADPKSSAAWRAGGWSWNGALHRPFDRIVLVDETGVVLGDALSGVVRDDVPKAMHRVTTPESGWIAAIARGRGREVIAYGLLADGRACELGRKAWPS